MILVDANILLYAYDSRSPYHEAAERWLEASFSRPDPLGIAWVKILAFIRISTSLRGQQQPLSVSEAIAIVSKWIEHPAVNVLSPGDRHCGILQGLLAEGQAAGPLATDAHLAALAIEHGATLASADRDFARFPGLSFFNPLIPAAGSH